jgi:hypothetical protein
MCNGWLFFSDDKDSCTLTTTELKFSGAKGSGNISQSRIALKSVEFGQSSLFNAGEITLDDFEVESRIFMGNGATAWWDMANGNYAADLNNTRINKGTITVNGFSQDQQVFIGNGQIVVKGEVGDAYYGNNTLVFTQNGAIACDRIAQDIDAAETNYLSLSGGDLYLASDSGKGANRIRANGENGKLEVYESLDSFTTVQGGTVNIQSHTDSLTIIDGGNITMEGTASYIDLKTIDLPAGTRAQFRQVSFCVDGETKTAYVLMTEPS